MHGLVQVFAVFTVDCSDCLLRNSFMVEFGSVSVTVRWTAVTVRLTPSFLARLIWNQVTFHRPFRRIFACITRTATKAGYTV